MATLTASAVLALIASGHCVPPAVAPIMAGIVMHESGGDPVVIHRNLNGTIDVGLAQINSSNFSWLGLTMATAMDPCRNIAAGARVLLAKYNGNPPASMKAAYANASLAQIAAVTADQPQIDKPVDPCPPEDPDGWHTVPRPVSCPEPQEIKSDENDDDK